jgi:antitoxin component of RelBE/YafQ-DinJ toxin-antitoxin module
MAPLRRENIFQIRISEDERRMLQVIADEDGLTSSDVVRQFIRREWLRRYPVDLKPKSKKK